MKYGLMPRIMWAGFRGTFQKALTTVLNEKQPKTVMKKARQEYRMILDHVTEFDKGDRFLMNILSCAMLSAIIKNLSHKYTVEEIRSYYKVAMNSNMLMRYSATHSKAYTEKGRKALMRSAEQSQNITNPYSWKFTYEAGKTINQYTATFYTCGICTLMKELQLYEYVPAMCTYDYDMAAMNHTEFLREQTLAGGGKYCDCHYNHRPTSKEKYHIDRLGKNVRLEITN